MAHVVFIFQYMWIRFPWCYEQDITLHYMQANLFSNLIIRSTGVHYCSQRQIKREINGNLQFYQVALIHSNTCFVLFLSYVYAYKYITLNAFPNLEHDYLFQRRKSLNNNNFCWWNYSINSWYKMIQSWFVLNVN